MKISIFSEDAGTTREETDIPFKQFYQGSFLTISSLYDQLDIYGDVRLHILSEQFGLVQGDARVDEYLHQDQAEGKNEESVLDTILENVAESDVIVILLSASRFDSLVVSNWERIMGQAKSNSIWCLGAARSSLAAVDCDPLRQKSCKIVTYERVGVARISNEAREELLEKVDQQQTL